MSPLITAAPWKKIALGLIGLAVVAGLLCAAGWKGYRAGYDKADLKRKVELAALRTAHTNALAEAENMARKQLEAAILRANTFEREYLAAQNRIRKQARQITKERIAHASNHVDPADHTCRFGAEWVRLYNEAIGAGAGDSGGTMPTAAPGPVAEAGTAQVAQAGILSGGATVTPEDILAHVRDYGQRNRALAAQLGALIDWAENLNAGEVAP